MKHGAVLRAELWSQPSSYGLREVVSPLKFHPHSNGVLPTSWH